MAVFPPPVELPTNRQSRLFDHPVPNIHDPNYIPLLNGATVKVDFSKPKFESFPSVPTPAKERPDIQLSRSKSSLAPERVAPDEPIRKFSARNASLPRGTTSPKPTSDDENNTSASEDNTTSSGVPSTQSMQSMQGAMNLLEDQIFAIPGNAVPKAEDIAFPAQTTSRSSTRKSVPTSRYNRKAQPAVPAIPSGTGSKSATPRGSPRMMSPDLSSNKKHSSSQLDLLAKSPTPPPAPAEPFSIQSTPKLGPMKSTASERRQKALHSHPYSSFSVRSKPESVNEDLDEQPLFSTGERGSSSPRPRSRSDSIVKSQQSPAPSTPLPDLPSPAPALVKSPSLSLRGTGSPLVGMASAASLNTPEEHTEMAEFMTTNKTVIFRRFDEVHVRLLLHLQDEIAALEKELLGLEVVGTPRPDKAAKRATVMQELRKVLAEYDHLFANWSHMQSSKATPHDKEQLEKWLKHPTTGSGIMTKAARDDVEWLQNSKDLSTVSLVPHNKPIHSEKSNNGATSSGALKGFTSLFSSCAGRRK